MSGQWSILALVLTCATAVQASGQERSLKRSDLPPAVQQTADEQSKGATVRGYSTETDNGQVIYEVSMTIHGRNRDVTIAADGTVLEIEQEVALDSLPAAVQEGLKQQAGSATIGVVEALTKHGALVAYEAHLRTGTKRSEIQVGPDGKRLAHPE